MKNQTGTRLSLRHRVSLLLTFIMMGTMLYSTFAEKEMFPFAPYTMYSYGHSIKDQLMVRFYCDKTEVTNAMSMPLDEALLMTNVVQDFVHHRPEKAQELIKNKTLGLKEKILKNGYPCGVLRVELVKFKNIQDFMDKKKILVQGYES